MTVQLSPHNIAAALVIARSAAGLSQQDVADRLGVTRQMVSHMETSDGDVQLGTLARWAAALGFDLALVAHRPVEVLVDGSGAACVPDRLHLHAFVSGPDRERLLAALVACRPGARVAVAGSSELADRVGAHEVLDADAFAALPARLAQIAAGEAGEPGVVVVDRDVVGVAGAEALVEVLGRARAAGWSVFVSAQQQPSSSDGAVLNNVASVFHAADGAVVDGAGASWTLELR